MHSTFLTQIIRSSSRLRQGQSPWAVSTGLAKKPQTRGALERQIYWCCFQHQLRIKIYEKHREFFWQQGHFSLLPAPAAAVVAKLGLPSLTPPPSCLFLLPDDSGRYLAMVCTPLCVKFPCSHMTGMSQGKSNCLAVCFCEHMGRNEVLTLKSKSRVRSN